MKNLFQKIMAYAASACTGVEAILTGIRISENNALLSVFHFAMMIASTIMAIFWLKEMDG